MLLALLCSGCGKQDSGAYDRGLADMAAGEYDAAIEEFQTAADTDGREAEAYRCEGIAFLKKGTPKAAISLLELSLEKMQYEDETFSEDVKYYLAEAYEEDGQETEAISLYQELEQGNSPARAMLLEGRLQLNEGNTEEADRLFSEAVQLDGSAENYIAIYEAYSNVKLEANGADYLQEFISSVTEETGNTYELGLCYYYLGEYSKAKEVLLAASEDENTDAIMLLGRLYMQDGETGNARDLFQRCLSEGNNSGTVYNGLALCSMEEGDYETALDYINDGLATADVEEKESLLFNEIIIYEGLQQYDVAKEKVEYFLQSYPDNESAVREKTFLESR